MNVGIRDADFLHAMTRAVVGKSPRYHYPDKWRTSDDQCRYFRATGRPACIIGTALSVLGYGPDDVTETRGAAEVLGALGASDAIQESADQAQNAQDSGVSWIDALDTFMETYRRETTPRSAG